MDFSPFGWMHGLVVLVSAVLWWLLIRLGRNRAQDEDFYATRLYLAVFILTTNFFWILFKLLPSRFNIDSALPLHMCDFAWMASTFSILSSERKDAVAHQLVFFLGLGLSTQAFIQPTLYNGPQTPDFWFFWVPHWQIVAVALLNHIGFGFRPTKKGLIQATIWSVSLASAVSVVNYFLDTPYCFTGRGNPSNPTVVDFLPAWPWRIPVLYVIVIAWFSLLTLIFSRKSNQPEV